MRTTFAYGSLLLATLAAIEASPLEARANSKCYSPSTLAKYMTPQSCKDIGWNIKTKTIWRTHTNSRTSTADVSTVNSQSTSVTSTTSTAFGTTATDAAISTSTAYNTYGQNYKSSSFNPFSCSKSQRYNACKKLVANKYKTTTKYPKTTITPITVLTGTVQATAVSVVSSSTFTTRIPASTQTLTSANVYIGGTNKKAGNPAPGYYQLACESTGGTCPLAIGSTKTPSLFTFTEASKDNYGRHLGTFMLTSTASLTGALQMCLTQSGTAGSPFTLASCAAAPATSTTPPSPNYVAQTFGRTSGGYIYFGNQPNAMLSTSGNTFTFNTGTASSDDFALITSTAPSTVPA